MKPNYSEIAAAIALILEDERSSGRLCIELGKYVKSIIEDTDLTQPETVRRFLPVAATILEERDSVQSEFQNRIGGLSVH